MRQRMWIVIAFGVVVACGKPAKQEPAGEPPTPTPTATQVPLDAAVPVIDAVAPALDAWKLDAWAPDAPPADGAP